MSNGYPKDTTGEMPSGTWRSWSYEGKRNADFTCTNGHQMTLMNHGIDTAGVVSPSVVCPVKECSFHEWIWLMGWVKE